MNLKPFATVAVGLAVTAAAFARRMQKAADMPVTVIHPVRSDDDVSEGGNSSSATPFGDDTVSGKSCVGDSVSIGKIPGIPPRTIHGLKAAGYETVGQIRAADDKELLAIKGVGEKSLCIVRDAIG